MDALKEMFAALVAWITAHPLYTAIIVLILSALVVVSAIAAEDDLNKENCFTVEKIVSLEQNTAAPGLGFFLIQGDSVRDTFAAIEAYVETPFDKNTITAIMFPFGSLGQTGSNLFFFTADGCAERTLSVPIPSPLANDLLGVVTEADIPWHPVGNKT